MKKRMFLLGVAMLLGFLCSFSGCKPKEGTINGSEQGKEEKKPSPKKDQEQKGSSEEEEINAQSLTLERKGEVIDLPYEPMEFHPNLPNKKPAADLSDVENIDTFLGLTEAQKNALAEKGFFIGERLTHDYGYEMPLHKHMHEVYEENEYFRIPNFITTDAVLHMFHIFYDAFLKDLEERALLPLLKELNGNMLSHTLEQYKAIHDPTVKALALKNVAYFAMVEGILEENIPKDIPEEAFLLAEKELEMVQKASGSSVLMETGVDFSQLKPRGHYTKSKELEQYFKAVMYYGQAGFFIGQERQKDALARAFLITQAVVEHPDTYTLWCRVFDPITFLVEGADDLVLEDMHKILHTVHGIKPDMNQLLAPEKVKKACDEIVTLPDPKINPEAGKSFRFMSQRSVFDSVLMKDMIAIGGTLPSDKPIYSGKDLFGVFGMKEAEALQKDHPLVKKWAFYEEAFEATKTIVESMKEEDWKKNIYRGWLWTFMELIPEWGEGYPYFMQTKEWKRKDLNAGLGSWAEMKHDSILYGKQIIAETGGDVFVPDQKGFVEPNVNLYHKLAWLVEFTHQNLEVKKLIGEETKEHLKEFQEILTFLRDVSIKELEGKELTEEEYERILYMGGTMEWILLNFLSPKDTYWSSMEDVDDMCVVADLMEVPNNSWGLEAGAYASIGVAPPRAIFVLFPIGDQFYLGRGSVFSVYEFISPERLNDEQWRERVHAGDIPSEGDWLEGLLIDYPIDFKVDEYDYE